jgi:hypothetical protein
MNYGKLIDQSDALYTRLNNAAYHLLCKYAKYPSYLRVSKEDEQKIDRINALMGKVSRRTYRRMVARGKARGY